MKSRFVFLFVGLLFVSKTSFSYEVDLSGISEDNCKREYNKCMNSQCYNDGFGRCACSAMSEQNIPEAKRNGLKGIGYTLYMKQKSECAKISDKCPALSRKIVSEYKMAMDNDCAQLALGNIKSNLKEAHETSYFSKYERFKKCMKPLCSDGSNPDLQFTKCFTMDDVNSVARNCKSHADSMQELAQLKEEFLMDMGRVKGVYCDRIASGEIRKGVDGAGECFVEIAFGYYRPNNISQVEAQDSLQTKETGMKIFATRKFKMGEVIDCSEIGFNTKAKIVDNTAKLEKIIIQSEKIRMVGDIINLSGTTVSAVSSLASGGFAEGSNKFQKIMSGVGKSADILSTGLGVGVGVLETTMKIDMLEERSKNIIETSKNNLFCFIDQVPFIQEGSKFRLNWIE